MGKINSQRPIFSRPNPNEKQQNYLPTLIYSKQTKNEKKSKPSPKHVTTLPEAQQKNKTTETKKQKPGHF